jgi:hypothetical protein
MHPRVFLDGFWRSEIKYEVFVAMPFGPDFDTRFASVYEPAINHVQLEISQRAPSDRAQQLKACRVDNSRSGDSILTEIMEGIAHSYLVLADLSEVGRWVDRSQEVRTTPNGNVMYEVGLALASRQPSEVILVRDRKDKGKLLFDISTIPCQPVDFDDLPSAIKQIQSLVVDRAKEIDWRKSHKVSMTLASLTHNEIKLIRMNKQSDVIGWKDTGSVNFLVDNALPGLLSKGILRYHSIHVIEQVPLYTWTSLGNALRQLIPNQPPHEAKT